MYAIRSYYESDGAETVGDNRIKPLQQRLNAQQFENRVLAQEFGTVALQKIEHLSYNFV